MRAMAPARSATAAMLLGAAAGCGVGAEQPATLTQMSPAMAYDEAALPAAIEGQGFRPAYRFDTGSGSAALEVTGFGATLVADPPQPDGGNYPLSGVMWESDTILGAEIPAGIPAGLYDLVVVDPGGHTARRPQAFASLGPDVTPPLVQVSSPSDGGALAAGATIAVVASADDGWGKIAKLEVVVATTGETLEARDCPLTGGATAACTFTLIAPDPSSGDDSLTVTALATDGAGLVSSQQATVALLAAPIAAGVSPAAGSTLGGTVVTLSGANFYDGPTEVVFDGLPGTISSVTPTSLTVTTPAHVAGPAAVTVITAGATTTLAGGFTFVAPPRVREIDPTSGPAAGYTAITIVGESFTPATQITFNGTPLLCPLFVNANRIRGLVPPGAGTEAVLAYDPVGGEVTAGNVPFDYLGGAPPGPTDAGPSDAGPPVSPPPPDGGCPGSGAP
jgi:hypothetical protein